MVKLLPCFFSLNAVILEIFTDLPSRSTLKEAVSTFGIRECVAMTFSGGQKCPPLYKTANENLVVSWTRRPLKGKVLRTVLTWTTTKSMFANS